MQKNVNLFFGEIEFKTCTLNLDIYKSNYFCNCLIFLYFILIGFVIFLIFLKYLYC